MGNRAAIKSVSSLPPTICWKIKPATEALYHIFKFNAVIGVVEAIILKDMVSLAVGAGIDPIDKRTDERVGVVGHNGNDKVAAVLLNLPSSAPFVSTAWITSITFFRVSSLTFPLLFNIRK